MESLSASTSPSLPERADAVVVGAGFGGLAAALTLAEAGAQVVLCEALNYPGGCASTFTRDGRAFEAGATLFSGFGDGDLFDRWIKTHRLPVSLDWIDPVVACRTPDLDLAVPRDRDRFIASLSALPGAPVAAIARFFRLQARVADTLWRVLGDPSLLPPLTPASLLRHAGAVHRYLPLARLMGKPLRAVMDRVGVSGFAPLEQFLESLCQITVQCGVDEAEAPLALATMDYYFRGTAHVRGGIGQLASALVGAVTRLGGHVSMSNRVRAITRRDEGGFVVRTRRGDVVADHVIANLLPHDLRALAGLEEGAVPRLDRLAADVETGWGAAMLYLVADPPPGFDAEALHLDLVADAGRPFIHGNHVFCSIGEAQPDGRRHLTVSTHVDLGALDALEPAAAGRFIDGIHEAMRATLAARAPEWWRGVTHELTASPRTFARFTRRHRGFVGGVPRRAGWHNYR
ncbi:MAG: FAD-binding protein, partial [Deltaproteobacteria bacterium]